MVSFAAQKFRLNLSWVQFPDTCIEKIKTYSLCPDGFVSGWFILT